MMIKSAQEIFDLVKSGWHGDLSQYNISEHFTWGEVFKNVTPVALLKCPRQYYGNAVIQAQTMEKVRSVFNLPVIVHCWYRDPEYNRRVKGAKESQHLYALATDFHIQGMESEEENLKVQKKLDPLPFMQTCGMEWTGGKWTHVDSRGHRERFPSKG